MQNVKLSVIKSAASELRHIGVFFIVQILVIYCSRLANSILSWNALTYLRSPCNASTRNGNAYSSSPRVFNCRSGQTVFYLFSRKRLPLRVASMCSSSRQPVPWHLVGSDAQPGTFDIFHILCYLVRVTLVF